jgi:hypothetical protein
VLSLNAVVDPAVDVIHFFARQSKNLDTEKPQFRQINTGKTNPAPIRVYLRFPMIKSKSNQNATAQSTAMCV